MTNPRSPLALRRLDTREAGFDQALAALQVQAETQQSETVQAVQDILAQVRLEGDRALLGYTRRFDGWEPATEGGLRIDRADLFAARDRIAPSLRAAMRAPNEYGTYIAIGITFFVGAQARGLVTAGGY